uniref:ABC1 atypical kinase-like domain-containing protein n=1 Tax=Arcella intermedia TaxID=1963864 RepID=A0A6B2L263_9EUKA
MKTIELFITNEQLNIEMVNQVHDRIAPQLLRLVEDLGGLYIKFGQEVAAMRGIVPDQYCDTMAVLQDNVPSISFEEVSKLFKEDFGQGIEELFVSFEKEPIAAASLAQVHKAVLPDNRVVAVKVQYPRVKYFHDGDLLTHRVVGHFLSYFYKQFRKPSEEFYTALHAELNFKKEAEHAKRARKNFSHRKDIYVPDIVDNLSSERILTMEFIDGFKVNNLEAISKHGFSTASIAQLVFEGNAEQVFLHGFIHADLHPGNILVRPIPGKPDKPQVVFLDHGLYGSIGDEFRVGYCKFWMALVKGDEKTLIDWCKKYGISDYKILSSVLMIQQFDGIGTDLKDSAQTKKESKYSEFQALYKNMTPEQRRHFKERMDSVTEVMNTVPEELLFILRSSFLLRGVNRELGAPINRFAVMARVASRGATTSKAVVESELSYYEKSLLFVEGAKFEWILRLNTFRSWLFTKLYNISVVLGMNEKLQEIGFALLRYMGTVEEEGPALEASASHS